MLSVAGANPALRSMGDYVSALKNTTTDSFLNLLTQYQVPSHLRNICMNRQHMFAVLNRSRLNTVIANLQNLSECEQRYILDSQPNIASHLVAQRLRGEAAQLRDAIESRIMRRNYSPPLREKNQNKA